MALDKFYFKVNKLDILDQKHIDADPDRYGSNASNVIISVDATAYGFVNSPELKRVVEVEEVVQNIHTPMFEKTDSFIDYNNLTEEIVISWIEENLKYKFLGEPEPLNFLKQMLEDRANTIIQQQKTNIPW